MLWRRLYSDVMLLGGQSKRKYCGFDIAPIFSTCPCQDTIVVICRSFHTTDPLNIILVFMCRALHSPSTVMSDTNGVLGIVATPFRGLRSPGGTKLNFKPRLHPLLSSHEAQVQCSFFWVSSLAIF